MTDLTWTDEPPSEAGWYYYQEEGCDMTVTHLDKSYSMYHPPDRMFADLVYNLHHYRWADDAPGQWSGPIPEPSDSE